MKKVFVLFLAAVMTVSAAACGNIDKEKTTDESSIMAGSKTESSQESSDIEESSEASKEVSEEQSEEESEEESKDESSEISKEVEKSLKVYDSFSKKYHTVSLWDSVACYGRFLKNSGYYKKDDLVRIIGKYQDDSTVIVYTGGTGVNFVESKNIQFLPKDYLIKESDRLIGVPTLAASKVLTEAYVGVYRNDYGLPCYKAKDEYSDDYGNSLDVVYDKSMIVKYGKLLRTLTIYSDSSDTVEKIKIPKGAYVGLLSYSYGETYGMFQLYNNGRAYTLPENINDDPEYKYLDVMDSDFVPSSKDTVYGLDEKTSLRTAAVIDPAETGSSVLKKITPINTIYLYFSDDADNLYTIISGDKLDVTAEDENTYTCVYDGRGFKISKSLVKNLK